MAKQTFTTGQVLTAAQMNSLQSNDFNQTVSVKTASYTLVAADKGTRIEFNTSGSVTCTVNTGLFDAGDTLIIQNRGAGAVTVTAGTATVNTEGSLVINQYGSGILYFISASASILFAGAAGDITGVTAGTGLTGGGSSGTVTLTNDMAVTITAKGDLLVGTGNATYDNLAVGTNGYTLVADSSVSPTGLKWAVDPVSDIVTTAGDTLYATAADTLARLGIGTAGQVLTVNSGATAPEWKTPASGSTFVGASVYKTAAQSISNNTNTALTFTNENFDTDGIHSNTTNTSRFTIPTGKGGKWLFTAAVTFAGNATGYRQITIQKNASVNSEVYNLVTTVGAGSPSMGISFIADAVATDYFELYCKQNSGGALNVEGDANYPNYTVFQCVYLGA